MFKAMAMKELREIRGIVLIGLLFYALLVISIVSPNIRHSILLISIFLPQDGPSSVPFVFDSFEGYYLVFSLVLAIAIGLIQTIGESVRGTYLFLLHRPASRRQLIAMKLIVGLATYLVCAAMPIVVYGIWAATHAMLFEWAMTGPSWKACFVMTIPYFGAFMTGIRPGRWYGSRLLPLLATVFLYYFLMEMQVWALTGTYLFYVMLLFADCGLILAILHVTNTRDFS